MIRFFVEALDICKHPIKKAQKRIRIEYYTALSYTIKKTLNNTIDKKNEIEKYVIERLRLYHKELLENITLTSANDNGSSCLSAFAKPWRNHYRYMLVCDAALILLDEFFVRCAAEIINEYLTHKQQADINQLTSLLQTDAIVEKKYFPAIQLIDQYRANKTFLSKKEQRIIVTANMSAGKSTLINSLIGKTIARTSQEVCTGNICYLFNKAFDDNSIHLSTQDLNLKATSNDLHKYDWNGHIAIASFFVGIEQKTPRLCIIDTPGVDASLYKEHSRRAHSALLNENYDTIIYVISPTRLGTDAEKNHLNWVAQHLQNKKVIFVLNKLDEYHHHSDNINESIYNLKNDLLKIGFKNPIICPISAYFSYLIKLKMTGQVLSEDEEDEYAMYKNKFKKSYYDLSIYYEGVRCLPNDSEEIELSKHAGLYGLEKIIYGGNL